MFMTGASFYSLALFSCNAMLNASMFRNIASVLTIDEKLLEKSNR